MAAPTLSEVQKRKTLRSEKAKVHKPKTHLLNPYSYSWPVLDELVTKDIMERLTDLFKSLPLCKPKLTWKERQQKRDLKKTAIGIEESEDERKRKHLRSQLVIGVNEITRRLEKDELSLFIVCRSTQPSLITKHLVPLAACRKCPALCIPQFSEQIGPLLGIKSVITIGFKKLSSKEDTEFSEFIHYALNCAIPIDMPWVKNSTHSTDSTSISEVLTKQRPSEQDSKKALLAEASGEKTQEHHSEKYSDILPTIKQEDVTFSKNTGQVSKFIPKDDYSYLYVFKSDKKKHWGDFIKLGDDESSDSESPVYKHKIKQEYKLIKIEDMDSGSPVYKHKIKQEYKSIKTEDMLHATSPKKRKQEDDENEKELADTLSDFPHFTYKPTKIGQQFKNPNKKKKKKKLGKK